MWSLSIDRPETSENGMGKCNHIYWACYVRSQDPFTAHILTTVLMTCPQIPLYRATEFEKRRTVCLRSCTSRTRYRTNICGSKTIISQFHHISPSLLPPLHHTASTTVHTCYLLFCFAWIMHFRNSFLAQDACLCWVCRGKWRWELVQEFRVWLHKADWLLKNR